MDLAAPGNEIKVAIRVRPLLPKEQVAGIKSRWHCTEKMITPDSSQSSTASYVFDRVFDEGASNKMVYDELASDIVKQAMIGFNGTLFTYGQSGSGKTYTIDALRAFAIKSAYDYIENCPAREFLMRVSYIELYNEKLTDLLSDGSTTLTIREDYDRNVYIDGLQEIIVKSQDHVKDVLTQGNARRTFAETKLNERSSRAHCIFRLVIESREREDPEHSSVYVSYLNLVDLAGSEKAGENSGERLREGVSINLSLLTLSQVIRKLSGEQREFINYRDSRLTRILQNALEGNSKTAILCTVAPFSVEETHSTLRFALNAKKVKTKPQQNEVLTDSAMLKKSQLEITKLKNKIKELEERNQVQDNDELQRRRAEREHLIKEFSSFLCVSSKAREEKRGFDKKRRETVCVPQMLRSADFKVPGIPVDIPKLGFFNPQPKQVDSFCIPESPPTNDSVFAVSHSLDSPCRSPECSYCDLSFTGFEQAIVQDSVLQKYKSKLKIYEAEIADLHRKLERSELFETRISKYEAEIADLNTKLKKRSGLFVTSRGNRKAKNKRFGHEFLNPTLCEEDEEETFVNNEGHMNDGNERLDENVENIFEGNETLKLQNNEYKNEIEGLKNQLEALTVKMTEFDEQREESAKYVAKLNDRIKRDEEIIKEFKAREEEMTLQYEKESKRWQEKVEKLEWERSMQEMMKEEKGLLETSSIDKNEASEREAHDDLEIQKTELLNEWEDVGRLKEELNKQAIDIEKTLGMMEKEKERLQKERERIDREWNELEKANDDLRKEKEGFYKKQEDEESTAERLLAVQETARPHLRTDLCREAVMLENDICVTSETSDVMSESHASSPVDGRYPENITLNDEKEALLRELDSLRQSVSELNARKYAVETEMANCILSKCENNVECLPEKTDMPGIDRLQEEWEILRKAQKQQKDREIELSEQEAASERIHDRCCMLEELNERLEEEVQKWRQSQHDHEPVNVTIHEGNALSMLNNLGLELQAETSDGKKNVEHDRELVRRERLLQEEYKKLTKYQAELSKQEENVERKIERLCMLEEEKEELEVEKERFYREKECLREAEMDLMKAKEDFKQERLKVYQELDVDRQGNMLNRNQVLKDEEKLHEQWVHLRKVQEQFQEENEEALEQAKTEDEAKEALNREWNILRQAQNDFRIEKNALENSNVNMKRRVLSGRRDTVNVDRLQDNLSQLDDESGIVTATSWDNSSLSCEELKDRSETMSVYIHEEGQDLQEKKEDCQEQWKFIENAEKGMHVQTISENDSDRNVKCLVASENLHSFDGKLTRQGIMETVELIEDTEKEQVLQNEEDRCAQYTIDKLQTLHDEMGKLELEKEKLVNEKTILQSDKEQLQEMVDTLQRENKMLKAEISDNGNDSDVKCLVACVDSHSFEGKLTRQDIADKMVQVDNVQEELGLHSDEERYAHYTVDKLHDATLHDELEKMELEKELFNEKVMLQTEKEQFQEMIDTLQRENKMLKGEISANSGESDVKCLMANEDSHSFDGKLTILGNMDKIGQAEDVQKELKLESEDERCLLYTTDKQQTLHDQLRKLKLENKQLFNEKAMLQTEKEQFQEMIDTLQRENKIIKGEIENPHLDMEGHQEACLEKPHLSILLSEYENNIETCAVKERNRGFQNEWENLKANETVLERELFLQPDRGESLKEENQRLQKQIENLKQCLECLQQNRELPIDSENMETQDMEQMVKTKPQVRDISVENTSLSVQNKLGGFHLKDQDLEPADLNEPEILDETVRIQTGLSQSGCDISRYIDVSCNGESNAEVCDLMTELKTAGFFTYEKKDTFDEDKDSLEEEWKKLKEAQDQLCSKEATLRDLEEDLKQRSGILHKFEAEQRLLQQSTDHLKQTEGILCRQQEELQVLEDNIKTELTRLLALQKEKEIIQMEIEKLIEDKMILEKMKGQVLEQQEIGYEKNAVSYEDKRSCKNGIDVTKEENSILQAEEEFTKETKTTIQESLERCHQKNCIDQGKDAMFSAQQEHLHREEELLEMKKASLQMEEERLQKEQEMLEDMKAFLQEEAQKLKTDKEMINEKTTVVQEEHARLLREQEMFERQKTDLFEEHKRLKEDLDKRQVMHQQEKETLAEQVAVLHEEQTIVQKEKDLFEDKIVAFREQQERLAKEKEIIEQNIVLVHEQEERLHKENERLEKAFGAFQKEQDEFQINTQMFEKNNAALQERQYILHKEKEMFEHENISLQKEKELFEEKYILFQEEQRMIQIEKTTFQESVTNLQLQQARYQNETEIVQEEKDRLQKEKDRLQEEKDRLQEEKDRLQEQKDILNEKITGLQQQAARYQNETEIIQEEKDRLQKEKDRLQEEKDRLQEENDRLNEKIVGLQQQQARYQNEAEIVHEEKDRLQKEKSRLQEEKNRLQEEKNRFQEEKDRLDEKIVGLQQQHARYQNEKEILQEEKDRLQEEKDRLQEEKDRLQEAEVNLRKEWDSFKITNDDIAEYREQLNEKEKLIESKMKHLSSFEKEKERFQNEWEKYEKACEDLKHEKVLLNERIMHHEEEKIKLQEKWDNVQQCREDLKQDNILFLEEKKNLQEELQSGWDNLRQAQDKVAKEEEAVSKKYAELATMQAVLEHERTLNDKDAQCEDQTRADSQLSYEDLMAELQKVEDELDNAYDKIDRLENLITKGKVMLAEKTEAVRQANDKVKGLEEAVDGLKSNMASLNSVLETKSNECEKLKKVHDDHRKAVREHEVLKKEMEAMVRGRTKDRECYEDTIRQLKLKLRDTHSAETSFFIQRDPPNQCEAALDQMRKIIEFENAAKFLELKELTKAVHEQKAKIADLEKEKSQLQAEIKKVQQLLENETVKSEAMKSTANQAILARRKVEEEVVQLRKQLRNGGKQNTDETPDEVTKSLKTQLQEKEQLIDQLSKSIDKRNMRWNAVAQKHKTLIKENYSLQMLVTEHQSKNIDSAKSQAQCNVSKDGDDSVHSEKQISLTELMQENLELKASVEKLKLEFQQQTVQKENHLNPQQKQSSRSAESLRSVHSEFSTQTENRYISQQLQQTQVFSAPSYRSGGCVESFVIAVKDKEIEKLKKKLEKQSEALKQVEQNTHASTQKSVRSEGKQQPEEPGHRRFQINNTDKENIPFGM